MKKSQTQNKMSRRRFLGGLTGAAAIGGLITNQPKFGIASSQIKKGRVQQICIFSKHLQWLDYTGMAETAAEIRFDGLDLTQLKN